MSEPDHRLVSLIIEILTTGTARTPSLRDVHMADAVLVLGEDVTNTAPLLDLALRQAARNKPKEKAAAMHIPEWDDNAVRNAVQEETGPLYLATVTSTKLDAVAAGTFHAAPDDIARLGFAIAHEVGPHAPAVPGLSHEDLSLAKEIALVLKSARRPLIISGTSLGSGSLIQAAANVAFALCETGKPAELCYTVPECNSLGAGLMGGKSMTPSTLRGEGRGEGPDTVIILENDLYRRADQGSVDVFLGKAEQIIVLDHLLNPTSSKAGTLLPSGTFAESTGTLVNNEGRAQRFYQVFVPQGDIQESWKWIRDIMTATGTANKRWQTFDDIASDMASAMPVFRPAVDTAPAADDRIQGQKIPRQAHRYSGRTAMLANVSLHEPKPPDDPDSPLAFSMEGYQGQPPAPLIARYWSPGWNSVQALNKFQQEVNGPLKGGDPGQRLIEPNREGPVRYYKEIPAASQLSNGEWLTGPRPHIFSSEELSGYAPGIAEQIKRINSTNRDPS
jgi:NADH-quinone oxidoreductase subunit G